MIRFCSLSSCFHVILTKLSHVAIHEWKMRWVLQEIFHLRCLEMFDCTYRLHRSCVNVGDRYIFAVVYCIWSIYGFIVWFLNVTQNTQKFADTPQLCSTTCPFEMISNKTEHPGWDETEKERWKTSKLSYISCWFGFYQKSTNPLFPNLHSPPL